MSNMPPAALHEMIASDDYWAGIEPAPPRPIAGFLGNGCGELTPPIEVAENIRELYGRADTSDYAALPVEDGEKIQAFAAEGVLIRLVQDNRVLHKIGLLHTKPRFPASSEFSEHTPEEFDELAAHMMEDCLYAGRGPTTVVENSDPKLHITVGRQVLYLVGAHHRGILVAIKSSDILKPTSNDDRWPNSLSATTVVGQPYNVTKNWTVLTQAKTVRADEIITRDGRQLNDRPKASQPESPLPV